MTQSLRRLMPFIAFILFGLFLLSFILPGENGRWGAGVAYLLVGSFLIGIIAWPAHIFFVTGVILLILDQGTAAFKAASIGITLACMGCTLSALLSGATLRKFPAA